MTFFTSIGKPCTECGATYQVSANNASRSVRCPACQDEVKRIARRKHRLSVAGDVASYKTHRIVLCPDDSFRCGAAFSKKELDDMAVVGFLPPGMVVEYRICKQAKYLEVVGGAFHRQSLVNLGKEEK